MTPCAPHVHLSFAKDVIQSMRNIGASSEDSRSPTALNTRPNRLGIGISSRFAESAPAVAHHVLYG